MTTTRWARTLPWLAFGLCLLMRGIVPVAGPKEAAAFGPARPGAAGPFRPPVRVQPHFTFAPYLQDVSTSSLVIAWSTDVPTTGLVRLYDAAVDLDDNSGRAPNPRAVFMSQPGLSHSVRLTGLSPGTRYGYVVSVRRPGDPAQFETTTPLSEFSTASVRGPFEFLVYGDSRDRDGDHATVIHAMLAEHADLVIQTGDMVSRANDEGQWRRYFATAWPLLRSAPLYPTLGNHELRGDPEALRFHRLFVLPQGLQKLPLKRRPVYYAFRYNNSLFLAVDGNSPYDNDQANWVERTLTASHADASIRHVFVFVHQPPYAVGAYCGSERLARRLVPIFLRHPVRAIFAGHEHAYQHLEREGLRYFISGGGGAPLYTRSQACNFEDDMALRLFRAEHHYLRIQVDGDAATLVAIDRRGGVMERVRLHDPVPEAPPQPPQPFSDPESDGPGEPLLLPPASPAGAPLLALSSMVGETGSNALPAGGRRLSSQNHGPLLLLWLSSIALISGLLLLARDLRLRRR